MTLRMVLFLTIKDGKGKGGGVQDSAIMFFDKKHNGQTEIDLFHVWFYITNKQIMLKVWDLAKYKAI